MILQRARYWLKRRTIGAKLTAQKTYILLILCVASVIFLYNYSVVNKAKPVHLSFGSTVEKVYTDTWYVQKHSRNIDGVNKDLILVNGMFPGPAIDVNVGDRLQITVVNQLEDESTSVHWHGITQRGTNHMDGAQGITQCGIPPGGSMTYSFVVDKSGTYWWHSHHETQRGDGMFGTLIVHDEINDAYSESKKSYDEEINIVLSDYYFDSAMDRRDWYLSRMSMGMEPVPDNGLINGNGVFNCSRLLGDRYTCRQNQGKYSEFHFEPGKKYRLRILNVAAMAQFEFSIDGHELHVIEADSTEVELEKVHYLPIAAGQRYSVIVEANQKKGSSVFMRAKMNTLCFNYASLYLDEEIKAIVRYVNKTGRLGNTLREWIGRLAKRWNDVYRGEIFNPGLKQQLPRSSAWKDTIPENYCLDLDEHSLVPLNKATVPAADIQFLVNTKIMKLERRNLAPYGFFNRTSWQPAIGAPNLHVELGLVDTADTVYVPTITGIQRNTEKWGGEQLIVDIPYGAVVELIINNGDEAAHPFHLHGHDFWVLRSYQPPMVNGRWTPDVEKYYRLDNPVIRDTVSVPRFGHTVIRFKADNPGIWAFHCHILWHVATGMMMQFREAADRLEGMELPQVMLDHCQVERDLGAKLLRPLPGSEYE